jgi:glutaconate CoA-transferase subunit A
MQPKSGEPPAPRDNTPRFVSVEELARYVRDGHRMGVGGLHFARLPLALLKQIVAQGRKGLEYISWGGGLPLELLLAAGAASKVVFCFSSLDIFGLAPLFRQALEDGTIEVEEWTALAMIQGFAAAQQQLPSMPFQVPVGSQILERSGFAPVYKDPVSGEPVGAARALHLDVCLLHAQRADEDGNVEIQGARGLDWSLAGAARQVLVTVEEVVPRGTFQRDRRGMIVPRTLVTAIAEAPWGAYPASCLPYYPTDYQALLEATSTVPARLPDLTLERREFLSRVTTLPASSVDGPALIKHRLGSEMDAPPTPDEQMVVTMARYYTNDSICSSGAVSPLAQVSYLLAKRTHAPRLVMTTMSSGFVDIGLRPMVIVLAEWLDFQTSPVHCGGDDTYHWYYQRGFVTHEVVSAAQVDRFGRANNILISPPGRKPIRLPGQGGMADVANMHRNFLLYIARHSIRTLVPEVDYASAARGLVGDEERRAAGYAPGYVRLVTNMGVFELNPESRQLELVSAHPGVTLEEIQEATGFKVQTASTVAVTEPPSEEELRIIRTEIDPLGARRLEFVAGRERSALIGELLHGEEAAIGEILS